MQNTHAGKAESYDLGRPAYPAAFYGYIYGEFGLRADAVIADIGAGRFGRPHDSRHSSAPPFRKGSSKTKEFAFVLRQDLVAYMSGLLSQSFSPGPEEDCFGEYRKCIEQNFRHYSHRGKLKTEFKLTCMIGNVNDLIP